MASGDLWKRKVRAFLYTPPHGALADDPQTVRQWAEDLVRAALGEDARWEEEIEGADRIARGLDIPPFVERACARVFWEDPCLTHPLSGKLYPLKELKDRLPGLDLRKIHESVVKAVEAIRREVEGVGSGDPLEKRLFLALWRKLPDVLAEKEPSLGPFWDVLPADPRIPSHSVWDHAAVASAVAGALPEPALLILDIASVQDFVAAARRTQDAWVGSFLLAFLMWEALKVVVERYGPDCVVHPSLREQPWVDLWLYDKGIRARDVADRGEFLRRYRAVLQIASLPERFTAIVPAEEARDLAEAAWEALQRKWKAIAGAVRYEVEVAAAWEMELSLVGDEDWEKAWERQIGDCFPQMGVFWVVCPWGRDPKEVKEAYEGFLPAMATHPARAEYQSLCTLIGAATAGGAPLNAGMLYPLLSRMAARALTARKHLRDFRHVEEPDWKCSLCGVRQALRPRYKVLKGVFGEEGEETLLRRFWEGLAGVSGGGVKLQGRIRRGDRLCAVCLTKRLALEAYFEGALGFDHHLFPSTATMAAAPFMAEVIERYKAGGLKELEAYVEHVKAFLEAHGIFYTSSALPRLAAMGEGDALVGKFLQIDGEWLFEESWEPERIRREYRQVRGIREDLRSKAVQALRDLYRAVGRRPSHYYAILAMDGDRMGDWVAGTLAPRLIWLFHPGARGAFPAGVDKEVRRPLGPALHLALSTALRNFALEIVRTVIEEAHLGKLIYAGGDDVLAFVAVTDLLPVMQKLRRLFQGEACRLSVGGRTIETEDGWARIASGDRERYRLLAGTFHVPEWGRPWQGPTASVGAVIVHDSHPLAQAIERARTALKTHAKEGLGRDAFAVHLLKRAGEPLEVGLNWYVRRGDQAVDVLAYGMEVGGFLRDGHLSPRLAYAMKERARGLGGSLEELRGSSAEPWWWEAQGREFERLVDRHLAGDRRRAVRSRMLELFQALRDGIRERIAELRRREPIPRGLEDPWHGMTKLILLAHFITEEGQGVALP
jgi:CRISPR-associated protein Cmr2